MTTNRLTLADAVCTAINQTEGGSEGEIMKRATELRGKEVTREELGRALARLVIAGSPVRQIATVRQKQDELKRSRFE